MDVEKIISELNFKAVRSSGAGGQNVNKVSSKVVLTFDLNASQALSDEQKLLLQTNLSTRLTLENILIFSIKKRVLSIKKHCFGIWNLEFGIWSLEFRV